MAYACSNCNIDHPNKRELVEHMHEKHNCTFLEGDLAPFAEQLLKNKKSAQNDMLLSKVAYNRGD